jgi:hypothetical protein
MNTLLAEVGELAALRPSPHRRSGGKPCRHCGASNVTRPRGLCWRCFDAPGVRQLYPSAAKRPGHGLTDPHGERPLPSHPTTALPGSPEKVAVLEARAALGVAWWHPLDSLTPD